MKFNKYVKKVNKRNKLFVEVLWYGVMYEWDIWLQLDNHIDLGTF